MLNVVALMGRLVADPELRHTPQGTAVTTFTIAVDRSFAKAGTERQTDFIDIVAWRQTGEFVSKYFTKGRMAVVTGRLQIRDWQDKDGNKRRSAEVVADNVYFGDSKRDSAPSADGFQPAYTRPQQQAPAARSASAQSFGYESGGSAFAELDGGDGELPF